MGNPVSHTYRLFLASATVMVWAVVPSPSWGQPELEGQPREKEVFIKELEKIPTLKEEKKEAERPTKKKWIAWPAAVGANFIYFEDSDEDRTRQLTETVQLYSSQSLSVLYGNDETKFEDRGSPNIYSNTNWVQTRIAFSENFSSSLFYGFKDYHNGGGDENVYAASLNHIWKDKLLTNLNFSHADVIQNNPAILKNLEVNQWSSLFDWIASKDISFQTGYIGSHYNDDNDSQSFYSQATLVWLDVPIISTAYLYSFTTYDFSSPFYFSFDNFQNHIITFSWEHNLAQNLGYAFRHYFTTDNADPVDWTSQFSAEILYAPWPFFTLVAQYSYYDDEIFSGNSFTSNTIYVSAVASF